MVMTSGGGGDRILYALIMEILYTTKCSDSIVSGVPMDISELDDRINSYEKEQIKRAITYMDSKDEFPLKSYGSNHDSCMLTNSKKGFEKIEQIRKELYDI